MRTLYLDCNMGAAGDMLTAALYELLDSKERQQFIDKMNSLGLPGVVVAAEKTNKNGIIGTHMKVVVNDEEETVVDVSREHVNEAGEEDHEHHEGHHDEFHMEEHRADVHHHMGYDTIENIIERLPVSEQVKEDAGAVYRLIAEAEGSVHGVSVREIHFHELGNMDAIADVVGACLLFEKLGADKIIASPVRVGSGYVRSAHGILSIPAPATTYLLRDVPVYSGDIEGELCTPTGAAILKYFASDYGELPDMKIENIGYGMGSKDFAVANCVKAIMGTAEENQSCITELSCNLDDMTPEQIGFAMDRLFALGALDVYTVPIGMKKSRPGVLLCVMCNEDDKEMLIRAIFKHTTTLGVRENILRRYSLERRIESIQTEFGEVKIKKSSGYGVYREKYEYDDLARIAKAEGLTLEEVIKKIDASK